MNNSPAGKSFFNSLQIFRGLAAIMVIFHHEWVAFSYFHNVNSPEISFLAGLGKYGVDFFFVLSGFIITYSNYDKANKPNEIKKYFGNRALRIYIPYIPISILMLMLYYFFPAISEGGDRKISVLSSLTLIPDGRHALGVAWTLTHEMMFYVFFILWFMSKKAWYFFVLIWGATIGYLNFITYNRGWEEIPFFKYMFSFYNLEFIFGFIAGVIFKKLRIPKTLNLLLLTVGLALITLIPTFMWLNNSNKFLLPTIHLSIAVAFALIILASINSFLSNFSAKNVFMRLGNASYSIYLVHSLTIACLMRIFIKIPVDVNKFLIFIIVFIACCIIGIFYSKIFERYIMNYFKNKFF